MAKSKTQADPGESRTGKSPPSAARQERRKKGGGGGGGAQKRKPKVSKSEVGSGGRKALH